ncbi:MAG: NAD(P)-dependent oxidoreductase, partial [Chloroflexota bacterium]
MKKRYVVVTGAAGGIGRATANFFAKKGWIVVGIDRASFDGDFPQNGLFIQADVSLEKDWQDIHGKLAERT